MKPGYIVRSRIKLYDSLGKEVEAGTDLILDQMGNHPRHNWFPVGKVKLRMGAQKFFLLRTCRFGDGYRQGLISF